MQLNLKKHKSDLLFIPLGGSSEIGMNVNLYHLDGKWMMVDCGLGFASDIPGVDMLAADISFIKAHKKDLLGIVITHIHEDHLWAVQYLWEELQVPIYASNFAAHFLKAKLNEYSFANHVKIHTIKPDKNLILGPFEIEFIGLTHSVPEMNALLIKTKKGNILHSGDWKFDPDPVVGNVSEKEKIAKYGKKGEILALVCDSTNALSAGRSGSEGELFKHLKNIIKDHKGLVGVTTFASNIARVFTIAKVASEVGRKVCITGFSLKRLKDIAVQTGYFYDIEHFISDKEIKFHHPSEILVISTGCQGEPNAGTMKLATDTHPTIKFKEGDMMIFSSKIIPGNEKSIFKLFNLFAKKKVKVITEKDHFVHVSGHPNQDEMKEMYELARPKISIPVHGEFVHLRKHAELAKEWGVPHAIQIENGSAIKICKESQEDSNEKSEIIGFVPTGYFGVDGKYLIPLDGDVIAARKKLAVNGIVMIHLNIDSASGKIMGKITIKAPGAFDFNKEPEARDWLEQDIVNAVKSASNALPKSKKTIKDKFFGNKNSDDGKFDKFKESVEKSVRKTIQQNFKDLNGKRPMIEVFVGVL